MLDHPLQVALGGALGASARYLTGVAAIRLIGPGFPWATLIVNILGSFVMGVLVVLLGHLSANRYRALADDRRAGRLHHLLGLLARCGDAVGARRRPRRRRPMSLASVVAVAGGAGGRAWRSPAVAHRMSGVQTLTVGPEEGDQRLDRWFRKQFPQVSQVQIEKLCRKGEIRRRRRPGEGRDADRRPGRRVRIPPLPDDRAPPPRDRAARRHRRRHRDDPGRGDLAGRPHHRDQQAAGPAQPGRLGAGRPPCRRAGRAPALRHAGEAAADPPARQGHLGRAAAGPHRRRWPAS